MIPQTQLKFFAGICRYVSQNQLRLTQEPHIKHPQTHATVDLIQISCCFRATMLLERQRNCENRAYAGLHAS